MRTFFIVCLLLFLMQSTNAQLAQKPSYYRAKRTHQTTVNKNQVVSNSANFLEKISSKNRFLSLARVYDAGTSFELPHALFLIDRKAQNKIYFIHTQRFDLHEKFIKTHFRLRLDREAQLVNYQAENRRFLLGTISWHAKQQLWTYEFWEGDRLNSELLRLTNQVLQNHFFAPLIFKTNANTHEQVAKEASIKFVTQRALIQDQPFLPLNAGAAKGWLRVIQSDADLDDVGSQDIVILKDVPLSLPPVAGVITEQPSTMLSHVNVLAKSLKIPNMYLRDGAQSLASMIGKYVELEVKGKAYRIKELIYQPNQSGANQVNHIKHEFNQKLPIEMQLLSLQSLRAKDHVSCGAKAANLGELFYAIRTGKLPENTIIPNGFCIPFNEYQAFMQRIEVQTLFQKTFATPQFQQSRRVRIAALARLREALTKVELSAVQVDRWYEAWQKMGGKGVFVRSSSNAEDLPKFSGAGLFSTVPNVVNKQDLALAVKAVWASVFNVDAFDALIRSGLSIDAVYMAVLVQESANAQSAGVMITVNPYDIKQADSVYISAKRGLGIRVVEGKKIAEEFLYVAHGDVVQSLRESDDDTALLLDDKGGVKEVSVAKSRVLSDDQVRELAAVASKIAELFKRVQDIEWAIDSEGRIVILQARPYRIS